MSCPCCGRPTKDGGLGSRCKSGRCKGRTSFRALGNLGKRRSFKKIANKLVEDAALAGFSGAVGVPFPVVKTAYRYIKESQFGLKISRHIARGRYMKATEVVVGKIIGNSAQTVTEKEAEKFSDSVANSAREKGIITSLSKNLGVDENVYEAMLKSSIKMSLGEGSSSLVEYSIDEFGDNNG